MLSRGRSHALRRLLAFVFALALIGGLGVGAPTPAYAQKKQTVETLINKGQSYFDEQRYEESIQTLSAALLRPGIAKEEKIRVYQLLAYNYIVLQREEEADGAVRGLLVLEEGFSLPDTESPRFREFFDTTRKKWIEEGKPGKVVAQKPAINKIKIKHLSPDSVDADADVSLEGALDDPDADVSKLRLYFRAGSSGKFQTAKVKYTMRKFSVDIPAAAVQPPIVEYYFEALNKEGLPLATRGDAATPMRIAVSDGGGVLESPWFWIPVGAAVIATVVVIAVVASAPGESTVTVGVFE